RRLERAVSVGTLDSFFLDTLSRSSRADFPISRLDCLPSSIAIEKKTCDFILEQIRGYLPFRLLNALGLTQGLIYSRPINGYVRLLHVGAYRLCLLKLTFQQPKTAIQICGPCVFHGPGCSVWERLLIRLRHLDQFRPPVRVSSEHITFGVHRNRSSTYRFRDAFDKCLEHSICSGH